MWNKLRLNAELRWLVAVADVRTLEDLADTENWFEAKQNPTEGSSNSGLASEAVHKNRLFCFVVFRLQLQPLGQVFH